MRSAVTIGVLVIATVASAQVTRPAEASFERGRELMADKKYAQACAAFEQSQKLDPQFGTQWNLANCEVELGKLATAQSLYRQLARSDTNPDRKADSEAKLAALEARTPKLFVKIKPKPRELRVTINKVDSTALVGFETPMDYGDYTLVATAPDHVTDRVSFTISASDDGTVIEQTLALARESTVTATEAPARVAVQPFNYWRPVFFAGLALLAGGAVYWGYEYSVVRDAEGRISHFTGEHGSSREASSADCGKDLYAVFPRDPDPTYEAGQQQSRQGLADACAARANTKFGLAAMAVGGFVAIAATYPAWKKSSVVVTPTATASSAGATIRWSF